MKTYSQFEIDVIFEKIWEFWPNKVSGENAPRKALAVALRSGYDQKEIVNACRIYSLENEGEDIQYIKKLNNFLNGDEWKDIIDMNSLDRLEKLRIDSIELITAWNEKCRKHWAPVANTEQRIPIAKKALMNESFKNNWKKALDKASLIFQYPLRESDSRHKLILSFRWFCDTSPIKHTVLRLIEGEYGNPPREEMRIKTKPFKEITDEERKKTLELFAEVFGNKSRASKQGEVDDEFRID